MSAQPRGLYQRVVALLLLLEVVSVYLLWVLNPVDQASQATFALFLAVDFVAFSMISYVYRVDKRGEGVNRGLMLLGCCMLLILLFGGLVI